jgi:hypothetical protein
LIECALALDPRSVAAQSWLALTLASRVINHMTDTIAADIARAEGLVAQALAASPRSATVHFAKGEALRAQRRYEEAIPDTRRCSRSIATQYGRCSLSATAS